MVQDTVLKNDAVAAAAAATAKEEIATSSSASPLRRQQPPPLSSSPFYSWGRVCSSPSPSPSSICRRHTITAPASMITSGGILAGNGSSGEDDIINSLSSNSTSNSNYTTTMSRIFTTPTHRGKGTKPTTTTTITTRMVSILLLSVGLFYIVAQVAFVFSNTNVTTRMKFLVAHHDVVVVDNTTIATTTITSGDGINSSSLVLDDKKNNHDDFALAYRQSFGFFHDVSSEHWRIHQRIVREYYSKHMYPRNPSQQLPLQVTAWYQENYDPNFSCAFERRIGGTGNGDGPKWVCDIHRLSILAKERQRRRRRTSSTSLSRKTRPRPGCVVYSVGSNGDFSFEWGIQNAVGGAGVCEIHIFDPGNFGSKMPKELEATYHRWGIANETKNMTSNTVYQFENNQGNVFLSLEDTIKALGHERLEMIDILKIDCEGCEWDVYEDWLKPSLPSIQQILVEVHQAPMDRVLSFFDRLMDEGYVIFHKEPNIQYNPSCIEYGFLKIQPSKGVRFIKKGAYRGIMCV